MRNIDTIIEEELLEAMERISARAMESVLPEAVKVSKDAAFGNSVAMMIEGTAIEHVAERLNKLVRQLATITK